MTKTEGAGNALAFIGFGEAAQAFLSGWALTDPGRVAAHDIKSDDETTREAMEARYRAAGIAGAADPAAAVAGAETVFCLVTADAALAAARAAAPHLAAGAFWLDGNSCAPGTKRQAAEIIAGAGGRYVDMAVMAPVHPAGHRVPLLLSGPDAKAAAALLEGLGMRPRIAGAEIGRASAIKMIRSVMIKGMEALTAECLLAARRAGVEDAVLDSLEASDPGRDWRGRSAYNLERMMVHGARRAAEMRESARTVAELGLGGGMAAATAEWQDRIAATGAAPGGEDLMARADAILARL
ncbi:NAD(P)-dependent oxidoreductase [Mangrovicoccus algicola]|uniref:DUF1932 domain-containing protein n=1 Tax=Mangrovicoccus algicola TaxID=2771008 RepID=A0A8J7CKA7_9RHOB|nr:NAD(P)-dependent oxidoreductase [Mangrovicoccus algicola]MBE3638536.1 DUF1932 domain-containing protein [Mangrovicoccus algicola]